MTVYDSLEKMFQKYLEKKKRSWSNLYLRESEKSLCVWYLWNLKTCENGEVMSPFILYGKLKWVGVILPNSFRWKPIRWVCASPLDVWDSTPPGAFNSTLRNLKHQWQVWGAWNIPSHTCELKNHVVLCCGSQNPVFSFLREGKIKVLRGYCEDKGPSWYTGPWALFGDVDTSEEK